MRRLLTLLAACFLVVAVLQMTRGDPQALLAAAASCAVLYLSELRVDRRPLRWREWKTSLGSLRNETTPLGALMEKLGLVLFGAYLLVSFAG